MVPTRSKGPTEWSDPGRLTVFHAHLVLDIRRLSSTVTIRKIAETITDALRACTIRQERQPTRISRTSTSCPASENTAARSCAFTWITATSRNKRGEVQVESREQFTRFTEAICTYPNCSGQRTRRKDLRSPLCGATLSLFLLSLSP